MGYTVRQEKFEGPLDLLLELIREEKLSINEISLAKVTDDFIAYLKSLPSEREMDHETLAEFLVIASQLLLIKSQSLLPEFQPTADEETSIAELESRLAEYQRIKRLAEFLGRIAHGGPKSFSREAYAGRGPVFAPPARFIPAMLSSALRIVAAAMPSVEKLTEEKIRQVISIEKKIEELKSLLEQRMARAFSELVAGAKEKVEIIVSFLALLELAKQRRVSFEQHSPFGEIIVRNAPHP